MSPIFVEVAGQSDVGLFRERNEDELLVADLTTGDCHREGTYQLQVSKGGLLLSVFDGMGGAVAGDRASQLASEVLAREVTRAAARTREDLADALGRALLLANGRIRTEGEGDPSRYGMGTTVTAVALLDRHLVVGHVGDSRAYLLRGGDLVQITEDQSLVHEMVARGQVDRQDASLARHANVVLQALGVTDHLRPFMAEVPLCCRDLLLLCTDGLSSLAPREEIQQVLAGAGEDLASVSQDLTILARKHGGYDNSTVVVARFDGEDLDPAGLTGEKGDQTAPPAVQVRTLEPASLATARRRQEAARRLTQVGLGLLFLLALGGIVYLLLSCDSLALQAGKTFLSP